MLTRINVPANAPDWVQPGVRLRRSTDIDRSGCKNINYYHDFLGPVIVESRTAPAPDPNDLRERHNFFRYR